MIRIPFKSFRIGPFMPVFSQLMGYQKFGPKMLYRLTKLHKKIDKAHGEWNEQFINLVKAYAIKDEKGEIAPRKDPAGKEIPNSFEIMDEHTEVWKSKLEELDLIEAEIDLHKINLEEVMAAGYQLSPHECFILEAILTDGEEAQVLSAVK